jgi:hypothetical protein
MVGLSLTKLHAKFLPPVLGFMLAMALIQMSPSILNWWHARGQAIDWLGVKVLTPVVRPGGILRITYTAVVHRQCPSDLRTFIVAPNGALPVRFPTVRGGYTPPSDGPVDILVEVQIPTSADPGLAPFTSGPHVYRTVATRYCAHGFEDDVAIPDARFLLEVPGE